MELGQPLSVDVSRGTPWRAADLTRRLYAGAAITLLIVTALGFQEFYLHGRNSRAQPLAPPLFWLLMTHGIVMTAWMLLLVAQALLVTTRKIRLHMALGWVGVGLAPCVVVLGFAVAIETARLAPPQVQPFIGIPFRQFLGVILSGVVLFAVFVGLGILCRKRAGLHRPLMLAGTLTTMGAAADRYPVIASLYKSNLVGAIFGPYSFALGFGVVFLLLHAALTRSFDRYFALCWAVLALVAAASIRLVFTPAWDVAAGFLLAGGA